MLAPVSLLAVLAPVLLCSSLLPCIQHLICLAVLCLPIHDDCGLALCLQLPNQNFQFERILRG